MRAQAENLGSEFHETKNLKCLHAEMLASGFFIFAFFLLLWGTRHVKHRFLLVAVCTSYTIFIEVLALKLG